MPDDTLYDGHDAASLARLLGVPRVVLFDKVGSTLDVAHALGEEGAVAGTLVLADEQTASRGRGGKQWTSAPGAGLWMTFVERPADARSLEVLSLRLGIRAAEALDQAAGERVGLKWPNDLYTSRGKLAGILVEARWQEQRIEWVAVGMGVNVLRPTGVPGAAGLRPGVSRVAVLRDIVPALRSASLSTGLLTDRELEAFSTRDVARGRRCSAPAAGTVVGITGAGELRVASHGGEVAVRSGSLVLEEEA
jgi:BirA family biotin operon repressor/biotin-[acetyl-CoA-carboxylase] ligase